MIPIITTVKKGMVRIPQRLQPRWRNREVFVMGDRTALIIKPVPAQSRTGLTLSVMAREFRAALRNAGQRIRKKDIDAEIKLVRKERYG